MTEEQVSELSDRWEKKIIWRNSGSEFPKFGEKQTFEDLWHLVNAMENKQKEACAKEYHSETIESQR